jgi:drug/metabolite transporter (DMT)-like permease
MYQADVTAIYMVAPVFVALVGFGHFKEKFSWPILLAGLIALGGAWLFIKPGSGVFQGSRFCRSPRPHARFCAR